jgi:hypothetical protein
MSGCFESSDWARLSIVRHADERTCELVRVIGKEIGKTNARFMYITLADTRAE